MKRLGADKIAVAVVASLAKIRQKKQVSFEELAGLSGLHATSLSLIERRKRQPTFVNVCRIALALKVRLSRIVRQVEKDLY